MEPNKELTYVWIENRTWKSISFFILKWILIFFLIFEYVTLIIIKGFNYPLMVLIIFSLIAITGKFYSQLNKIIFKIVVQGDLMIIEYVFKKSTIKIADLEYMYGYSNRGGNGIIFKTKSEKFEVEFFDMDNMFAYYLQNKGVKVEGIKVIKYPLSKILTNVPEKFKKPVETKNEEKSHENEN